MQHAPFPVSPFWMLYDNFYLPAYMSMNSAELVANDCHVYDVNKILTDKAAVNVKVYKAYE
jgi:hypothetical protein